MSEGLDGDSASTHGDPDYDLAFDTFTPRARRDVLIRDLDDGVVAWSPIGSEPLPLEPLSAAVLQLLDGDVSARELIADLCEVLDVPEAVARDLLRRELALLDSAGMLTTSAASAEPERAFEVFPAPPNP